MEQHQISRINSYIYLSGMLPVTSTSIVDLRITCLINCIRGYELQTLPTAVDYLMVPIDDNKSTDLRPHFATVANTIDRHRRRAGRVLVFCAMGISRSASLVIAYLMRQYRLTLVDAYRLVQRRRNIICPNIGFFQQLIDLERQLHGADIEPSVKIIEPAPGVLVADVVWTELYEEIMREEHDAISSPKK